MNLGNTLGIPREVFKFTPDNRLILPSCRIGLEFEFEGVKGEPRLDRHEGRNPISVKDDWAAYWLVKADGSLHDLGCEWLFSRPLFGVDVVEAVTGLCDHAIKNKFKVSIRTALHAHIDVRDMLRIELARMNTLYCLFEKGVYNFAANNREENVFCIPWYKSDQMARHARNVSSESSDLRSASEALANEKYSGLNLDSLARFGSVEFRHALTTTDAEWIFKWINLCLSFKRAAQKLAASPLELVHNLSAIGVEAFARQVFEDQFQTIWYPQLEHDVWSTGVETALAVIPQQQGIIDKANLSWNRASAAKAKTVNSSFKAYMDKPAKKEEPVASRGSKLVFDFERVNLDLRRWAPVDDVEPEPEF